MAAQPRPLSPHLQVYKQPLTAVMSIMHRGTGMWLSVAAFGLMAWLLGVAGDGEGFAGFADCVRSIPGQIVIAVSVFCLVYHLLNGIRHLLWDIGWGYELPRAYASGWTVLALTAVITAALAFAMLQPGDFR